MFAVRAGARIVAVCSLWGPIALGVFVPAGARRAAADETSPPPAAAAPSGVDQTPQAGAAPVAGAPPSTPAAPPSAPAAPPSAPAALRDSVVAAPAVKDSTTNAPDAAVPPAKDMTPAEQIENASAVPAEKLPEATLFPAALAKPVEPRSPEITPPKVAPDSGAALKPRPRLGARGIAPRGVRGAPKARALAKPPVARAPADGILPKAVVPHEGLSEADRVASELERTERFVGRAQRSILVSKNTRAMKLYTSALDFQSDSREACKVRQYARAERLTLAARDFADRASRMVGPPREDPDYVEHVLRRTDDAIERAKDVLKTGAGRYAWQRHEDLKQEQKDAWRIFKGGDVGGAYKQTLGVREGVLALLRQLQDLPVPRETAEKAIGGAQAALEQANRELGPKPSVEAVRLVRLANEYLVKARQSFQHGSYRSALLQAKVVERHVEHAVDVGRPRSG